MMDMFCQKKHERFNVSINKEKCVLSIRIRISSTVDDEEKKGRKPAGFCSWHKPNRNCLMYRSFLFFSREKKRISTLIFFLLLLHFHRPNVDTFSHHSGPTDHFQCHRTDARQFHWHLEFSLSIQNSLPKLPRPVLHFRLYIWFDM